MPTTQAITVTRPRAGSVFLPDAKDHIDNLWRFVTLPLTSVGGSGKAYTAVCKPTPIVLVNGSSFWFYPNRNSIANPTLKIGAMPTKSIVRDNGTAIPAGMLKKGVLYLLVYDGSKFRTSLDSVSASRIAADSAAAASAAAAYDELDLDAVESDPTLEANWTTEASLDDETDGLDWGTSLTITDWNDAITAGTYQGGSDADNAPDAIALQGTVTVRNVVSSADEDPEVLVEIVTQDVNGIDGTTPVFWRRTRTDGTWGDWISISGKVEAEALSEAGDDHVHGDVWRVAGELRFFRTDTEFNFIGVHYSTGILSHGLITKAPTTAGADFRLGVGVDPTSPVDGDLWRISGALKARIGSTTYELIGRASGAVDAGGIMKATRFISLDPITLADDTAIGITPPAAYGHLLLSSVTSALRMVIGYRTTGTAQVELIHGTANTAVTTGLLTGTTGTDGNFTVSPYRTDGKIYLESRRGSVTFDAAFLP